MHETLLYNSLFSFRVSLSKENAKHHLFDNLESEKEAVQPKEFTDDDLRPDPGAGKAAWEYQVKSTPRKASVKDSMIDPNNPYINNNLDADLGRVIRGAELGKHKTINRKQINT